LPPQAARSEAEIHALLDELQRRIERGESCCKLEKLQELRASVRKFFDLWREHERARQRLKELRSDLRKMEKDHERIRESVERASSELSNLREELEKEGKECAQVQQAGVLLPVIMLVGALVGLISALFWAKKTKDKLEEIKEKKGDLEGWAKDALELKKLELEGIQHLPFRGLPGFGEPIPGPPGSVLGPLGKEIGKELAPWDEQPESDF
jgi:uncharacterized protein YhaN